MIAMITVIFAACHAEKECPCEATSTSDQTTAVVTTEDCTETEPSTEAQTEVTSRVTTTKQMQTTTKKETTTIKECTTKIECTTEMESTTKMECTTETTMPTVTCPTTQRQPTPLTVQEQVNAYIKSIGITVDDSLTLDNAQWSVVISADEYFIRSGISLKECIEAVNSYIGEDIKSMYCYYGARANFPDQMEFIILYTLND